MEKYRKRLISSSQKPTQGCISIKKIVPMKIQVIVSVLWYFTAKAVDDNFLMQLFQSPIESQSHYSCQNTKQKINNFHFRGTALGGWMVLEPWLTPSLFYQFLGATAKWGVEAKNHVAIDSFTFCTALGKEEANRQLRNHWKTWVTEEQISNLANIGVTHLRLPVGDWMYIPYEPYIGCWDGALEEVDRVLALCAKYNIEVMIDLHAMKGSQNGLDNSGNTGHYQWVDVTATATTPAELRYQHWLTRGGDWAGPFNTTSGKYSSINSSNIIQSLRVVNAIVDMYADNKIVIGIEPVNEPWDHIPMDILKEFYWRSYRIVQLKAPHWVTLLHDSFRLNNETWGPGSGFMTNCDKYAVDTHIYQAWAFENPVEWFQEHACSDGDNIALMESLGVPVIVGEWSLATDNCAMWLNGLNDNVPGYPQVQCERVQCPPPYTLTVGGFSQPGAPPDASLPAQDPFGLGGPSYVEFGTCPRDRPFPNDTEVVRVLSYAKLRAFDYRTHGQFFWNFRTEFEPRWDYQQAVQLGWLPTDWESNATQHEIATTCDTIMAAALANQRNSDSPHSGDTPSLHRLMELSALSTGIFALMFSVAAILIFYFVMLQICYGANWNRYTRTDAYQSIPDSLPDRSVGAVELGAAARNTDDTRQQVMFPAHGGAGPHISPYQEAIIVHH